MRIALDHFALRLHPRFISAELSPGDEELLIGSEAINGRLRLRLLIFLKREVGNLCAPEVADRLTQNQLAVVMYAGLDGKCKRFAIWLIV